MSLDATKEILNYAKEELRKALKLNDMFLYWNASDKALLAINTYIEIKEDITPKSHSERRRILRKIGKEELRAHYSDLMKTLHDEAFYERVFHYETFYESFLWKNILTLPSSILIF